MSANRNSLCRVTLREIKGTGLVLERGEEEEAFFKEVCKHIDMVDCTYSDADRRTYFFADPVPEDRVTKFLDLYNAFGRKLWNN